MALVRRFTSNPLSSPKAMPRRRRRPILAALAALALLPFVAHAQIAPGTPLQLPATPLQNDAQSRKIQDLLTRAQTSYNTGLVNYNANHLEAARQDFDSAVDLLLTSGLDLKNDPQLSEQFERLLDAINSLEMQALKQGNGFSPKIEETPLETATDTTFAPNPELVAKLTSELNTTSDLPLVINDQVAGYINVFAQSNSFRAHMSASMARLGKYRTMMQNILKQEGVPQDVVYLAVAESGFQPQVVNARSGAGGMWQFMSGTGTQYGLTRNGYFDYRFDPEKSTRAYARYIKSLYGLFNDWYLAMAAYDWGPGNIQRVVSRTGYADFWELYRRNAMPAETRAYVPQILAAVIMAKNPEKYGLNKLPPSPPVIYDTVNTDYAISVPLVADLTGSSVQEIVALNPSLLRLSTPRDIAFDLHIPPGTSSLYQERLKDIPDEDRASWRFHVVKPGETLEAIATQLHASPAQVAQLNEVTAAKPVEAGDELVIPLAGANGAGPGQQRYTSRRGDTLITIADRFGVTPGQLRSWNHLSSDRVKPGRTLYVVEPIRLPREGGSSRSRRGRAGHATAGRSAGHAASRGAASSGRRGSSHTPSKATHSAANATHARRRR